MSYEENVAADRKRLAVSMVTTLGLESSYSGKPDPADVRALLASAKAHEEKAIERRLLAFSRHGATTPEEMGALLDRAGHRPFVADPVVACQCGRRFSNWMKADAHVVQALLDMPTDEEVGS